METVGVNDIKLGVVGTSLNNISTVREIQYDIHGNPCVVQTIRDRSGHGYGYRATYFNIFGKDKSELSPTNSNDILFNLCVKFKQINNRVTHKNDEEFVFYHPSIFYCRLQIDGCNDIIKVHPRDYFQYAKDYAMWVDKMVDENNIPRSLLTIGRIELYRLGVSHYDHPDTQTR